MECDKVTYATAKAARNAVIGTSQRKKENMKYYKCSDCGKFHIATARKKFIPNDEDRRTVQKDASYFDIDKKKMEHFLNSAPKESSKKKKHTPLINKDGYATEKVFASLFNIKFDKKTNPQ